jgi:uncharacterized phage protein (TIGR02218 family)
MRAVDAALQSALDSGVTTLCRCWRVTRADGVALGFTDHDRPLSFDGVAYQAAAGLDGSAVETATGLAAGDAEILGALTSEAISEADIQRGLYDGAEVALWLVDWRDPETRHALFSGRIARIERDGNSFTAGLEGPAAALNRRGGRAVLPLCDARLGDTRCCAGGAASEVTARVASVDGPAALTVDGLGASPSGWFDGGALRWTGGANAGLTSVVRRHEAGAPARLTLWSAPPAPVAAGDAFALAPGCDKRFETCRDKFANALNFRGFPHVPGDDWVAAHPADGENHDGRSRYR